MAQQFVVIWSLFLYASSLLLFCCNAEVLVQQQQHPTKLPLADVNNVVEVGGQMDAGVGDGVMPAASAIGKQERFYHPAAVTKPRVIDQYDHRSLDGHFEYRYLLSNGEARYERAYWMPAGKGMVLARKGYYSYPLSYNKFLTVFYTADQNGYRQNSATYSRFPPTLPRSIEVPEYVPSSVYVTQAPGPHHSAHQHVYTHTTMQPTGNPFIHRNPTPPVQQTSMNQATVHEQIDGQSQSVAGHHSQVHHSLAHTPIDANSPVSGHYSSGAHSSQVGHHAPSAPSHIGHSSGVHSSVGAGAYSSSVVHSQAGVPTTSSGHASSNVHHSHGGAYSSAVATSEAHSSTGNHVTESSFGANFPSSGSQYSFGVHPHAVTHSQGATSHSSQHAHSSAPAHSASISVDQAVPSYAHSPSTHYTTVHPSYQVHQQYPIASHVSSVHHSAGVHATTAAPSVPIQSWHYKF